MVSVSILQKELVNAAHHDDVSEEEVAAAQKQLENINNSMEMSAGHFGLSTVFLKEVVRIFVQKLYIFYFESLKLLSAVS